MHKRQFGTKLPLVHCAPRQPPKDRDCRPGRGTLTRQVEEEGSQASQDSSHSSSPSALDEDEETSCSGGDTRPMSIDKGSDELLTLANLAARHDELPGDGLPLTPSPTKLTKQPKHSRGRASRSNRLPRYSQCHSPFWPTLQSGRARGAPLSHFNPNPVPDH